MASSPFMLSHMCGYEYDAILKNSYIASSGGGFTLNINELRARFGNVKKPLHEQYLNNY